VSHPLSSSHKSKNEFAGSKFVPSHPALPVHLCISRKLYCPRTFLNPPSTKPARNTWLQCVVCSPPFERYCLDGSVTGGSCCFIVKPPSYWCLFLPITLGLWLLLQDCLNGKPLEKVERDNKALHPLDLGTKTAEKKSCNSSLKSGCALISEWNTQESSTKFGVD
jgi:hypothetical protein